MLRSVQSLLTTLRKMTKDLCEYVCLDGVYVKEDSVIKMAGNAGSFAVAEHYLCALLAHGLMYGKADIINKVNEVREQYQALPYAKPDDQSPRDEYGRSRVESVEFKVRKLYSQMSSEQQRELLRSCLQLLKNQTNLFCRKQHWLGVMLVVRDRLDSSVNQSNFFSYALRITPEGWPKALCIGKHTTTNFSKLLRNNDWSEAYYDMESNPQKNLCEKFWEIVKQTILTEIQ